MQQEAVYEQGDTDMPCPLCSLSGRMHFSIRRKSDLSMPGINKQTNNEHPLKILKLLRIHQVNSETN